MVYIVEKKISIASGRGKEEKEQGWQNMKDHDMTEMQGVIGNF